jgi:hypothetical protein
MAVYHRTQRLQIYGEKPEVTQLFGGRYRMVVRCKAARDTEAWYNDNKDQIFASFGTLYSAQMSVDGIDPRVGEAYPDMCLVSNSASYTQTGEYVISFVYETLTAVWTKEQDDEVTSTDNGLRVLERSEVAKVDGFPIVQLSSPNSSKVVLSGMGNASNYFVLLVKANSANTIYWRATNEALATHTGSFTTANTDQWEYKVIYTPISIDQLEIGYNGTNYSTFYLSEFYLVSQSSDWQNNIVESFIEFEVTVNNPSPFTDTVVFTGSNGNTATGTNVQGGGTGSISSPYDEDDVGVATITDGGKTLYLASFQDQTGADNDAQVGRVVTRWAEAGVLRTSSRNLSEGVKEVTTVFLAVEGSTTGPIVSKSEENLQGLKTISVTTLQDKSGNSIVEGGENLVHRYQSKVDFTYPGIVSIRQDIITSDVGVDPNILNFELTPPVQSKLNGTISVIFQTSGNIVASDEIYNDGSGVAADSYWNPGEWARTYVSGIGWNYSAFSTAQGLRGYRVDTDVSGIATVTPAGANSFTSNGVFVFQSAGSSYIDTASSATEGSIFARVNGVADGGGVKFVVDGKRLYSRTPFILQASGGPVNPVGNRYVLDIDVRPAFEDVDGNIYYKKTIVTATP